MRNDHIQSSGVETAFGDNHIGVSLGGFDKFQVHRAHGGKILLDDGLGRSAALGDVTSQPADEADIVIGIDKDFQVEKFSQRGFGED